MPDTTTILPADPRTLNCPSWCQTDHAEEWATAVRVDAQTARHLAEYREHHSLGDQGRPMPPIECPPYHLQNLGAVTVRVGDGTQADWIVVVRARADSDVQPVEVVRVDPPTGWTEDYTPAEARGLAALLLSGAEAIEAADRLGRG